MPQRCYTTSSRTITNPETSVLRSAVLRRGASHRIVLRRGASHRIVLRRGASHRIVLRYAAPCYAREGAGYLVAEVDVVAVTRGYY